MTLDLSDTHKDALAVALERLADSQSQLAESQLALAKTIEAAGLKPRQEPGSKAAGLLFGKPVKKDTNAPETSVPEPIQNDKDWEFEVHSTGIYWMQASINEQTQEGWTYVGTNYTGNNRIAITFKKLRA